MPAILAFDSSAAHCAAALLLPDGTVLQRLEPMEKGQAERLVPFLQELLAAGGLDWIDLAALAVALKLWRLDRGGMVASFPDLFRH